MYCFAALSKFTWHDTIETLCVNVGMARKSFPVYDIDNFNFPGRKVIFMQIHFPII